VVLVGVLMNGAVIRVRDESANLTNEDASRQALVYLTHNTNPRVWRTRVERFPEHTQGGSGWFGGRVLWGHDKPTQQEAVAVALDWVLWGQLPEDSST
jgi:hypothetical protein